jgi:DNA-binding MltR family transcriptional regulator
MNYNDIEKANILREELKEIVTFLENANNETIDIDIRYHANNEITSRNMFIKTDTKTIKSFLAMQKESLIKQLEKLGVNIPKELKK